jgi:pyruvate dehydrogenase E2 component (dihydrolipoamide acetyltransferase)
MGTEVIMPALGVSQETGRVLRWLKTPGDEIASGEPLVEIETDKVTIEMEAPASGVLASIGAGEGEDVPVGHVIGLIIAPGELVPEPAVPSQPVDRDVKPATEAGPGGRPQASPLARRRAREAGVDLERVTGSGPGGVVTVSDVDAAVIAAGAPSGVTPVWRRMAEHVTSSWAAPHFSLARDVDAGAVQSLRQEAGEGVTVTDILVWISARALAKHPEVNARWQGGSPRQVPEIDVGIAVALDEGLIVPVIHGADRLDLRGIAEQRLDLVDRARSGALRPEDVQGGTFTVSNLGMFGVDAFTAIVNGPQAAILAVGRLAERVVAIDGHPVVRPRIQLTLSCDHRVVDGAMAARFLDTLATGVEETSRLEP